jgi:polysaccharide deacetylase family protein (PEP-CTERM system associated)
MKMKNFTGVKSAVTVDVEDAISLAMRNFFNKRVEPTERVLKNTRQILNIFRAYDVKGTFFILGEVADKYPSLVKEIDRAGHEIGVHGFSHIEFFKMTPGKAFNEISNAKKLLEDIIGKQVFGHRAPAFSINRGTSWAFDVIADAGFTYDSSVMPVNAVRYGWGKFNKDIHCMDLEQGKKLLEVPLSTYKILGREMPVCGGGYFRLFPYFVNRYAFRKILKKRPVIVYIHPHEIDTGPYQQFYMKLISKASFKQKYHIKSFWLNRGSVEKKIRKLLQEFSFTTIYNLIDAHASDSHNHETDC